MTNKKKTKEKLKGKKMITVNGSYREQSEPGVRQQLDVLDFRESEHHRLDSDQDVVVIQQIYHCRVEPVLRSVVGNCHARRSQTSPSRRCVSAGLNELLRCVTRDQLGFQQHVQQSKTSVQHKLQQGIQCFKSALVDAASASQYEVERC